jgi:2-dehydro-3-deoxygalactonokinase
LRNDEGMYILTMDSGTTNTRIYLVEYKTNRIVDFVKKKIGVRNTAIEGSAATLQAAISRGIIELLTRNRCSGKEVSYIVATGMITSNLGLFEVPHINRPGDLEAFAKSSVVKVLPEFQEIPSIFVPGMRTTNFATPKEASISSQINQYDVMRGEEAESFGLLSQMKLTGKGLFVLPGSHTKYVFVDGPKLVSSL